MSQAPKARPVPAPLLAPATAPATAPVTGPVTEIPAETPDLVRELASGERRFYQIPPELPASDAATARRQALEVIAGVDLGHLGRYSLDAERAATRHCENFIGAAQIPMGVAGPLLVRGQYLDGEVYLPLATTEGALIASINRGCAAIRSAGGARAYVEDVGMTRAPVFETSGLEETQEFLAWIVEHEEEIRRIAEGTSRYLRLLDIRPFAFGTTVFLRFRLSSGDAMGMNMATIACDRAVDGYIVPKTGVRCIALSGNYCVDKKPAAINFQEGRGKRIHAEVLLGPEVLSKYLKTNARALVEVQYRKNLLGSIAAGSQGFNAHMANVVAALFIATGQDLAHVVGGSMGITNLELRTGPSGKEDSVYAAVFLPDLPLGAVGGGTTLATQRAALDLLGVKADSSRPGAAVMRLGEIVGAAVLAGELSLMAAFTSRDLARAHERLGRGEEKKGGMMKAEAETGETPAIRPVEPPPTPFQSTVVSTPGKLILMGEHAVVYGRPALVTAIDLRLAAHIAVREEEAVREEGAVREEEAIGETGAMGEEGTPAASRIELPELGLVEEVSWQELRTCGEKARELWHEYQRRPSPETFRRVRWEDPAYVVKVALGEALAQLPENPSRPFTLRVDSELPVGAGFGSSAATAVAVIDAFLTWAGVRADAHEIFRLSLEVERRQHGQPSGVDNAAVLNGGLIWARKDIGGGVQIETLEAHSPLLEALRVFSSGTPAESTGAVVAAVRSRIDADPLRFEDLFDRMERATWGLRQELARGRENPLRVIALVRQYEACLEELGVVPEATRALIREVEARGGAAKISGAGALTGTGAGSLLVYHPSPDEVDTWDFLQALPRYAMRLGAAGVRQEREG